MAREWSDKYAVGIQQIDGQHRRFFDAAQDLADQVINCTGEDAVEGALKFLRRYAKEHFADEELLMQQHAFPGLKAHQGLHSEFIEALEQLEEEHDIYQAPTQDMADEILDLTQGWLLDHILNEDVQYVGYVTAKGDS